MLVVVVLTILLCAVVVNARIRHGWSAISLGFLEDPEGLPRGKPVLPIGRSRVGLLHLRGGSSESKKDDKIKGVCIGIDLGTTYR